MKNTKWHAWHAARVVRQIKKATRLTFLYFFFEINRILCTFVARYNFQNIINIINIQLMTTKKMYEKPSMRVFPLRQKPALLVGSPVTQSASIDDYKDGAFSWDEY